MDPERERIVVVGASLAGLRACEALRRAGFLGEVVVVGAEQHLPYDRPPLSKQVLRGEWPTDRLALRGDRLDDRSAYADLRLDLRLGVRATGLTLGERPAVQLGGAATLEADGVIVATGATPRTLPGTDDVDGVFVLRTLEDCLALRARLGPGVRLVVVGGGFIGSEVAASAVALGAEVTVLEALPAPMSRVLGPEMGEVCADLHRRHGVDLRTEVQVEGIGAAATGEVDSVRLGSGEEVPADVVVVGIGVTPATSWLEQSALDVDDGVLCDDTCRAATRVVAAGDVARWRHPRWGSMRVEHWTNAVEQGQHAARRLLAALRHDPGEPYAPVPYVWSDQHDTKLLHCGHSAPGDTAEVVWRASPDKLLALYHRDGEAQAAFAVNAPRQLMVTRRLIAERASVEEVVAALG